MCKGFYVVKAGKVILFTKGIAPLMHILQPRRCVINPRSAFRGREIKMLEHPYTKKQTLICALKVKHTNCCWNTKVLGSAFTAINDHSYLGDTYR